MLESINKRLRKALEMLLREVMFYMSSPKPTSQRPNVLGIDRVGDERRDHLGDERVISRKFVLQIRAILEKLGSEILVERIQRPVFRVDRHVVSLSLPVQADNRRVLGNFFCTVLNREHHPP